MAHIAEEEQIEKSYDARLMRRLLRYAQPFWKALLLCILLLGLSGVLELARPYLIRIAIDEYLMPGAAGASSGLIRLGLLLMGALITGFVVNYVQTQLLQYTGQAIIFRIRQEAFHHLQQLHLQFFDTNPTGRVVTRITNDTETLNEMYTSVLVNLFRDLFTLIGVLVLMFQTHVRLALVSLAFMPIVILYSRYFVRQSRTVWRNVRVRLARINAFFSEYISGMKVVQLFAREAQTFAEFQHENEGYFRAAWGQMVVWGIFRPMLDLIGYMAIALLLWYGGGKALSKEISAGVLFLFVSLIKQFFEPLMALSEKTNILQSAMAAAERLFAFLDTEPAVRDLPTCTSLGRAHGVVEFRNVWFAYEGDDWVLRDVSFRVEPGQTVAFVGHTGAGKSSIMNLLSRFYDVQQGAVLIDEIDVRALAQADLHRNVGLVAQDVFLFTGDIRSNIALGNTSLSDEAVFAAARAVEADSFIRELRGGYDEPVVERGATLSTGQRQLISFARALAFDPPILVLDEATASIDSETEATIQYALRRLASGRTTLIVAHRLSTVQHADQILVLHKGQIRERGTHTELLARGGLYEKLWQLQFEEQGHKRNENLA